MELNFNFQNFLSNSAKLWMDKNNAILPNIQEVILNAPLSCKYEKYHFDKFAKLLEENLNLICEIEAFMRGISVKDSKVSVKKLADYFRYTGHLFLNGEMTQSVFRVTSQIEDNDVVLGIFDDDYPLWMLGLFLPEAFANNYGVILALGPKLACIGRLLIHLIKDAGMDENSLIIATFNKGQALNIKEESYHLVRIFSNESIKLHPREIRSSELRWLVTRFKAPMLIFDNADFDSAIEIVIEAAWSHKGMLPWSINTILIQENVFQSFTTKFKARLKLLRVSHAFDNVADISSFDPIRKEITTTLDKARGLDTDVFQIDKNSLPALIIGQKIESLQGENGILTLLPFRYIQEGIDLVNESGHGLGVSIWTENIGLANEVALKLQVPNVWINGFGLFNPELPLCPTKRNGWGCFNGHPDYYWGMPSHWTYEISEHPFYTKDETAKNLLKSIKRGFKPLQFTEKMNILQHESINTFTDFFKNCETTVYATDFNNCLEKGYWLTSCRYPKGVLVIQGSHYDIKKLILTALFEGNTVILLYSSSAEKIFYEKLATKFPSGQVKILPFTFQIVCTLFYDKSIDGYYGSVSECDNFSLPSIYLCQTQETETLTLRKCIKLVTIRKNVWTNVGQSNECDL
ncbi:hypothetical protein ABEB36_011809 [Hypothenemus hampei]|uniref:Aldehyde dehydrogenase domain-containing protein n=1 Tax=Hypothenemus hampei TaxID=57062 RepID=A0ABD1E929_HYPHA